MSILLRVLILIFLIFSHVFSKSFCIFFDGLPFESNNMFIMSQITSNYEIKKKFKIFSIYFKDGEEESVKDITLFVSCDRILSFSKFVKSKCSFNFRIENITPIKDFIHFLELRSTKIIFLYETSSSKSVFYLRQFSSVFRYSSIVIINVEINDIESLSEYLDNILDSSKIIVFNLLYNLEHHDEIFIQKLISYKLQNPVILTNRPYLIRYGADASIFFNGFSKFVRKFVIDNECDKQELNLKIFINKNTKKWIRKYKGDAKYLF